MFIILESTRGKLLSLIAAKLTYYGMGPAINPAVSETGVCNTSRITSTAYMKPTSGDLSLPAFSRVLTHRYQAVVRPSP